MAGMAGTCLHNRAVSALKASCFTAFSSRASVHVCCAQHPATHLLEVRPAVLAQAAHMELALAGVADDDGAVTKRTTQEVGLVAQHTAAAQAVGVMHHLRRPAGQHSTAQHTM